MTSQALSETDPADLAHERSVESGHVYIKCRAKSGLTAELRVRDISLGGCMVECAEWTAIPGERVLVILPGLDWQPTRLVWLEDGLAGLAFEELLYEPLAIHLQRLIG